MNIDNGINFHYPFRWASGFKGPQIPSLEGLIVGGLLDEG